MGVTVYTLVQLELEICVFHRVIYMQIQSKVLHESGPILHEGGPAQRMVLKAISKKNGVSSFLTARNQDVSV